MPAIDTNISALQMGFWVKQTSTNYRMIVGVMSDLEDETTFVPVDTIINSTTSASEYHEVLFSNYTGNGHYIAFRNITPASYNYSYNYIDDITVDFIPTCPAPTNVTAELINDSTVTVTWTPFDNTQNNFEVAYGTGNQLQYLCSCHLQPRRYQPVEHSHQRLYRLLPARSYLNRQPGYH